MREFLSLAAPTRPTRVEVKIVRRVILAGLALLGVPALALAGARATDGTDTLKVRAKVEPAQASKRKGPGRPVEFRLDYVAGTTDGSRLPDLRSVSVYAGGTVTAYDAFPKCDESKLLARGPRACRNGSRVGSGRAVAEVHLPDSATSRDFFAADVTIYNGRIETNRNGGRYAKPRDGLLLYTQVEGARLALGFEAEDRNRRVTYYNPKEDPSPPADNAFYTVKEVHVTFPRRAIRRNGRRIPWIAAPRKCDGGWVVWATNDRYEGGKLTATHEVRCGKA